MSGAAWSLGRSLARWRVHLGFIFAMAAFLLVTPTRDSWLVGFAIALPGELLRIWASGHIDKGREITNSGPYQFVRHPLYLGSAILGLGFGIASANAVVAAIVAVYLVVTLLAAIRTEEATLDARFDGAYSAYREGRAAPVARPFRWSRVWANREYRAMAGFVAGFALLAAIGWWRQG